MSDAAFPIDQAPLMLPAGWIRPSLGGNVGALMSARTGGVSKGPYAGCNLGDHVGDRTEDVARNRALVVTAIGAPVTWLTQVHGNRVVRLSLEGGPEGAQPEADGALTTEPGVVCAVMVADCLPILLAAPEGRGVAALHAGWRGLAGAGSMAGQGVVDTGVAALCEAASCDPADLRAWIGPSIGPSAFEVGLDVLTGFGVDPAEPQQRFLPRPPRIGEPDVPRWLADLPGLALDRLGAHGVSPSQIDGGRWCTVSAPSRFFSFRRDGRTGRQAAFIWLR